jgi:uncharacterized protein YdcH (DUF465 family)
MFREHRDLITQLKQTDRHFEKLFAQHNELDQRILNAESGVERCTELELEKMKKEKLLIKDSIYTILQSKSQSA